MTRPTGSWAAEFVLIVVGVLTALAVDDWREGRAERALERHLLSGLHADAARDVQDLSAGIDGAKVRIAGTNELLRRIDDPDVDRVRVPPIAVGGLVQQLQRVLRQDLTPQLEQALSDYQTESVSAQEALLMATVMLRFDVADATYVEATASGQLDVIQDLDLRSEITQYYFDARRFGPTVDNRVEMSVERLVQALSAAGLSGTATTSDMVVLTTIRNWTEIVAELKNVRYWAAYQMERHAFITSRANDLATRLEEGLR